MEENKYLCPDCGTEMNIVYEKPALNLTCPKCGCKIATSKWDEIDLDDTKYNIVINTVQNPSIEQIKIISKITGNNFIKSKSLLQNGGLVFEGFAIDVLEKEKELNQQNISYSIKPFFKY